MHAISWDRYGRGVYSFEVTEQQRKRKLPIESLKATIGYLESELEWLRIEAKAIEMRVCRSIYDISRDDLVYSYNGRAFVAKDAEAEKALSTRAKNHVLIQGTTYGLPLDLVLIHCKEIDKPESDLASEKISQ